MIERIRKWLDTIPNIKNPLHRQQAFMFQVITLSLLVVSILITLISISIVIGNGLIANSIVDILSTVIGTCVSGVCLWLIRRGSFDAAVYVFAGSFTAILLSVLFSAGLRSNWVYFFALAVPITLSGLLGNSRVLWTTIGSMVLGVFIIAVVKYSLFNSTIPWVMPFISFAILAAFLGICFNSFGLTLQRTIIGLIDRQHELEHIRSDQERLIEVRTKELRESLAAMEEREQQLAQTVAQLQESRSVIANLRAPIIPVLPGVLLVPLLGVLDTRQVERLMDALLVTVKQRQARAVIFDITGGDLIDTHAAERLLKADAALRLVGAQMLMVGMQPEVAQTIVALGLPVDRLQTSSDLREAVASLLIRDGWRKN